MDTKQPLPTAEVPATETHAEPSEASSPCSGPKLPRLEPTRYGDWELNGKCVDF